MRVEPPGVLLGSSAPIQRLRALLPRLAAADSGVLIIGEPGTGREELARLVHEAGPRRAGPFSVVGCPGLTVSEEFDELFGGPGLPGLVETCAAGSIYLASVDERPGVLQNRLARYVEDAAHGAVASAPRLIGSARRDLARRVEQGRFREDLYYRLSVITLRMPPLRERREDIPEMARHLLEEAGRVLGKHFEGISAEALGLLTAHRWNGNLAELAAAIQRAAIIETSSWLQANSLPDSVRAARPLAVAS
ncbi:MAG: sigma-54-dependent Fis family transcriptional regulator [Deltaproteobacteria bacterium]|nr:sigma-54-dependent Fis family transcriptional regulator [Deltaproteobacteria bacterium]